MKLPHARIKMLPLIPPASMNLTRIELLTLQDGVYYRLAYIRWSFLEDKGENPRYIARALNYKTRLYL